MIHSLKSSNFWGLSSEMRIFKLAHAFSIGDRTGLCGQFILYFIIIILYIYIYMDILFY